MPEQILGAEQNVANVRPFTGSNALYVYDIAGKTGNVSIIGSVAVTSPISSTTSFDSVGGVDAFNLPASGLVIAGINSATGSLSLLRMTDSKLDVNATTSVSFAPIASEDTKNAPGSVMNIGGIDSLTGSMSIINVLNNRMAISMIGSPNYSLPVTGSVQILGNTIIIGSVLTKVTDSLPAGTALLGSVVTTPVGVYSILGSVALSNSSISVDTTTADYISMVGSPNYNLPITGSIQLTTGTLKIGSICGISESLPVGANVLGSVNVMITKDGTAAIGKLAAGTALIGSVVAQISADGTAMLGSVKIGAIPVGTNIIGSIAGISASLPVGPNLIGSICGIKESLPVGPNLIGSICGIKESLPVGANILGSVKADIQKFGVALPAGTALLGSVIVSPVGTFAQRIGAIFNVGEVDCGSPATKIVDLNADRLRLTITNLGTIPVYIGSYNVLPGSGAYLAGIVGYPMVVKYTGSVFGYASGAGTQRISWMEEVY